MGDTPDSKYTTTEQWHRSKGTGKARDLEKQEYGTYVNIIVDKIKHYVEKWISNTTRVHLLDRLNQQR